MNPKRNIFIYHTEKNTHQPKEKEANKRKSFGPHKYPYIIREKIQESNNQSHKIQPKIPNQKLNKITQKRNS
jgi:hypothetical protein